MTLLLGFLLLSAIGGHFYVKSSLALAGPQAQVDDKNPAGSVKQYLTDECSLSQTAANYQESICVDGTQIIDSEASASVPEDFLGYFLVTDEDSLISYASPDTKLPLTAAGRSGLMSYTIKQGDTAAKIAMGFGISLDTLLWANNLKSGSLLKPGQELIVLPVSGVKHEVKSGDNLASIAKRYGVSVDRIMAYNNINQESSLKSGETLIIPGGRMPTSGTVSGSSGSAVSGTTLPDLGSYFIYPTTGWNWGKLHTFNAIDIANTCGTPIYAAAEGLVVSAYNGGGWNSGYGNLIKIQHPNGTLTAYAHLSEVYVAQGQNVAQGTVIGRMGNTGNTTGPTGCHLHFEVRGAKNPLAK